MSCTRRNLQGTYWFHPEEAPEAVFTLAEGQTAKAVYAYCNLHGLWKKDL